MEEVPTEPESARTRDHEYCIHCRHPMTFHHFTESPCTANGCGCSQGVPGPKPQGVTKSITTQNYVRYSGYHDHPLADHGQVFEHRVVLHAKIGGVEHRCTWCTRPVRWADGSLHVDHLDGDRQNNDPSNLVPACLVCNLARGRKPKPKAA